MTLNTLAVIILGFTVAVNFIVIIRKWKLQRYFDTIVDSAILAIISLLFCGTFAGFVTGTIASAFVSLYLYFNPITLKVMNPFHSDDEEEDEYE